MLSATTPNSVHPVQQSRKTQLGHLAAEREGWSQLYSFYTSALAYKCTLRWSPPNIGAQSKYLFIPSVQCNANWDWWMVWPRLLLVLVLWQFPFEMSYSSTYGSLIATPQKTTATTELQDVSRKEYSWDFGNFKNRNEFVSIPDLSAPLIRWPDSQVHCSTLKWWLTRKQEWLSFLGSCNLLRVPPLSEYIVVAQNRAVVSDLPDGLQSLWW